MAQRHQDFHTGHQGSHQGMDSRAHSDLRAPVRNNYFYGKLLDVFHLEMEQEYFNAKRHLLNRLVIGPGVVCGLRVELADYGKSVVVSPGLAIDRCGREIVVGTPSKPYPLPELPPYEPPDQSDRGYREREADRYKRYGGEQERHYYYDIDFAHVVICYHECKSDPVPALASDCDSEAWCASGSIREQYSIEIREGFAPIVKYELPENIVYGRDINYGALVDFVTLHCRPFPDDCCIPLANIELRGSDDGWQPELDYRVCPIVYTNRLLYQLIDSLTGRSEPEQSEV